MNETIGKAWRNKGWQDIGSDINWEEYGGTWAKQDPAQPGAWWIVRHENMPEVCGSDWEGPAHLSSVYRVDTASLSLDDVTSALDCVGLDLDDIDPEYHEIALVEACHRYGLHAPMGEHNGTHPTHTRAAALREAEEYMGNADACCAALDRPVNAIGSTAREYGQGDINSAILRGLAEGNPAADLLARMGALRS